MLIWEGVLAAFGGEAFLSGQPPQPLYSFDINATIISSQTGILPKPFGRYPRLRTPNYFEHDPSSFVRRKKPGFLTSGVSRRLA